MSRSKYKLEKGMFHHIVLEGTRYDIGSQLAEHMKRFPEAAKFFSSYELNPKKYGFDNFESIQSLFEECCPGITDEVQGFADGLDTTLDKVPFYAFSLNPFISGNCSQLAVLSGITNNQHIYVGRTYEWNTKDEDLLLCTTRIKEKISHIGFSCLLFGRHDGMNEHGLVVSMTGSGIFNVPLKERGTMFWVTIRGLLDNCRSVDDCLERIESIPKRGYYNLLFADKNDNAAIVEFAEGAMAVNRVSRNNSEHYVFSTNHYRLPRMERFNKLNCGIISHSKIRDKIIANMLHMNSPNISKENVRELFATLHPEGLCNHFYEDTFGTLWSMIFDVTELSVDVCFSAPTHNEYRNFKLDDPMGVSEYPVVFPITSWS
jgi:predicted choloylglycine hydrolase